MAHMEQEHSIAQETTLCLPIRGKPPQHVLLGLKREGFGAGKITGFGGKVEPGETAVLAGVREMREETGIRVRPEALMPIGQLFFLFPTCPSWSQLVHAFLTVQWEGIPRPSTEMIPRWYAIDEIPYGQMWHDATYWLPRFLAGERIRARFIFGSDNETVVEADVEPWEEREIKEQSV